MAGNAIVYIRDIKDSEVTHDSLLRSQYPRIFVGETSERLSEKRSKYVGETSAPPLGI